MRIFAFLVALIASMPAYSEVRLTILGLSLSVLKGQYFDIIWT